MFVVIAPEPGATPEARYSFAPSRTVGGRLVDHTGSGTDTDRDDMDSWALTSDPEAAAAAGVTFTRIDASDDTVREIGHELNSRLGTVASPGPYDYDSVPTTVRQAILAGAIVGPLGALLVGSQIDGVNSNSAAYYIAQTAVSRTRPGSTQRLPPGARAPGWGAYRRLRPH